MTSRRKFIKLAGTASSLLGLSSVALNTFAKKTTSKITILHTNDFEGNFINFNKLYNTINREREQNKNVLLFDSGDFLGPKNDLQGKKEFSLLKQLNYTAIGLGNKDFIYGINRLSEQIKLLKHPVLASNYIFKNQLQKNISNYHTVYIEGIKIGVFALGIDLTDYYTQNHLIGYSFKNPVITAIKTATYLKEKKHCDFVICLSHLGYEYANNKISDLVLANNISNIDLILGGHTHTNLKKGVTVSNKNNHKTVINQTGSLGNTLGKIDLVFEHQKVRSINCQNIEISTPTNIEPAVIFKNKKVIKQ